MIASRGATACLAAGAVLVAAGSVAAQPANDLCGNAVPIGNGPTAYSTVGANTDGSAHLSCQFDGQTYHDIWYTYNATCTGELTVSTCGTAGYDTDLVVYDGCDCANLVLLGCNDDASGCSGFTSELTVPVVSGGCYLVRVGGWNNGNQGTGTVNLTCIDTSQLVGACCLIDETCVILNQPDCQAAQGSYLGTGTVCSPNPCSANAGPDVVYSDCTGTSNYGAVGGIRGYALGSNTCNMGTQDLLWTNDGTPALAMNAYRLHGSRLQQIGLSWVKTACCAAAGSGCGLPCNGHGGSVLGVGCLDVYGSGWNGIQGNLGPRSGINPWSGAFQPISGGSGDAIFRRLQIRQTDLSSAGFPGALYFIEGQYIGSDDAAARNDYNNASYKRVTIDGSFNLNVTGPMNVTVPAIFAWRDHGLGVNMPDPSVQVVEVDVPGEGRFYLASKVTDQRAGVWGYNYAVFNLNSHRSGGSVSVPIPPGAIVSNVGFSDVDYHSGEPYDNTDWNATVSLDSVKWTSPQTYAQNVNSNALRWGTMYSFWFDADVGPGIGDVTLGLFRPGTPGTVSSVSTGPCLLLGDINGDMQVNGADIAGFVGCILSPAAPTDVGCGCADLDGSGSPDPADVALFVTGLLSP